MALSAQKRLMNDLRRLQADPPVGLNGTPIDDNLMSWKAVICGPEDTPWEGGIFHLTMEFGPLYPAKPPVVRFVTKMFHPNVYRDGNICMDILQSMWSPVFDVSAILLSIQSLLSDPYPFSPANQEAAILFAEHRGEYNRRVRMCVNQSLQFHFPDSELPNTGADAEDDSLEIPEAVASDEDSDDG